MCDTFIALQQTTADASVIFGKNSDREANEPQIIEYHPEKLYPKNTTLKCTYLEIPQVQKTQAVIISRPFWMWGAEMGVNNKGVVIGNEAVFTKLKVTKTNVLTGMDLLRLALERASTAEEAKHIIIDLIEKYGQGGIGGYRDKNFTYHNSFIIADKKEAWVLETAGAFWVTKKVDDFYAISNGLTITSDYDAIHPKAVAYATKKGWAQGQFSFVKAFSDTLYITFSGSKKRQCRAAEMLKNNYFKIDISTAMAHLRDHNTAHFEPSKSLISNTVCAHAANGITRHASQTTNSMIVHLTQDKPTVWVTATAAPCLSVFKPLWFEGRVIPNMGPKPNALYDASAFWWRHEMLHREVLKDFSNRQKLMASEIIDIESKIAFEKNWELLEQWLPQIKSIPIKNKSPFLYRNYWQRLNKKVGITV